MRTNRIIFNILYFEQEFQKILAKRECNKSVKVKADHNILLKLLGKYYNLFSDEIKN